MHLTSQSPSRQRRLFLFRPVPNISVERDRRQAALTGSLRGYAAPAAPHVKRWASQSSTP